MMAGCIAKKRPGFLFSARISLLPAFAVKKRLQNKRCSHLIDYPAVLLACMTRFIENPVRLAGGQPLIPQMDGQAGQFSQLCRKYLSLRSLRACIAREMHGMADHNPRHAKPPTEPRQRAQIFSPVAPPLECHYWLRRETYFVRHRYADAAVAHIEPQVTWLSSRFWLSAHCFQIKLLADPGMPALSPLSRYNQNIGVLGKLLCVLDD